MSYLCVNTLAVLYLELCLETCSLLGRRLITESKESWKSLTKSKVLDVWEQRLRGQADYLKSLKYFHPGFMSLTTPHPMWASAKSPFEVRKAVVVARMLSGRYRSDQLARHWSKTNQSGLCQLPGCSGGEPGSLEHILLNCQLPSPDYVIIDCVKVGRNPCPNAFK